MTINKIKEGEKITLLLEGWLDVETSPELDEYLKSMPEVKNLTMDFSQLEYISSSGVRSIVSAYRKQKEIEGSFEIINVSDEVMDIFSMTGLNRKISIKAK